MACLLYFYITARHMYWCVLGFNAFKNVYDVKSKLQHIIYCKPKLLHSSFTILLLFYTYKSGWKYCFVFNIFRLRSHLVLFTNVNHLWNSQIILNLTWISNSHLGLFTLRIQFTFSSWLKLFMSSSPSSFLWSSLLKPSFIFLPWTMHNYSA